MSTFTLAISCLTTSNLPWFMDLTFQVPMQYCSLQHRALLLSPVTSTTGYCFCFGSIPSFFLLFTGLSRQEYWSGLPSLLQWTTFCQTSPSHDPPVLGGPTGMAWFHWVRQGCGPSVIRLTSFLWLWFQCVFPLMPSCNTYHLTKVSYQKNKQPNQKLGKRRTKHTFLQRHTYG